MLLRFQLLAAKTLNSLVFLLLCFGSTPAIPVDLLAKSFQIDEQTASQIGGT